MQRIALLLALSISTSLLLTAQSMVGLRAGVGTNHIATTAGLDVVGDQLSGIISPEIGLFAEFALSDQISLQPELQYTSRGFAIDLNTDATVAGIRLPIGAIARSRFHYVEMPVLFKASFGNEATKAYVVAGPSVGYAMSGNLKTSARALIEFELVNTPINLSAIDYQRLAFNGVVGLGVQHNLASGVSLVGDLRYTHGFSQLYDIPLTTEKLSNRAISASIGLGIQL